MDYYEQQSEEERAVSMAAIMRCEQQVIGAILRDPAIFHSLDLSAGDFMSTFNGKAFDGGLTTLMLAGKTDDRAIIDQVASELVSLGSGKISTVKPIKDILTESLELLNKRFQGEIEPAIPTGFVDLDQGMAGGLHGAYLLVGGGQHVWEEAIESLVNPRQSEMKQMIEPHFTPAHTHPFEALLNQPLKGLPGRLG
jgi:hypothetical protein